MDIDEDIIEDKLEFLHADSQCFNDTPSHVKCPHSKATVVDLGSDSDLSNNFLLSGSTSAGDSESDSDMSNINKNVAPCIFDSTALSLIHQCLSNTIIPSWIERPPTNLGEKSHDKLKADNWLVLFSIFLPLVLPEIWTSTASSQNSALLHNFYDLVLCTNILCSYLVKPEYPDIYLHHYIEYRRSSALLFPNIHSPPNHHYAMHNGDQMQSVLGSTNDG
ncbi:hypothetical protein CVT24_002116 [Panaeolus cyanescens]|uniref:Uncharacterized protein n=1 Tax=Panaeolus cyanescens TaxID=181874 RepID=A0A409WV81_9AGAR|nr:hypothetical protein CVT24_002116 [Panaeolus cyanescens]